MQLCLRENKVSLVRRTEKAMARAMCGAKLLDKKNTGGLMNMLGLRETVENLAKASRGWWYGHVLRKDEDDA